MALSFSFSCNKELLREKSNEENQIELDQIIVSKISKDKELDYIKITNDPTFHQKTFQRALKHYQDSLKAIKFTLSLYGRIFIKNSKIIKDRYDLKDEELISYLHAGLRKRLFNTAAKKVEIMDDPSGYNCPPGSYYEPEMQNCYMFPVDIPGTECAAIENQWLIAEVYSYCPRIILGQYAEQNLHSLQDLRLYLIFDGVCSRFYEFYDLYVIQGKMWSCSDIILPPAGGGGGGSGGGDGSGESENGTTATDFSYPTEDVPDAPIDITNIEISAAPSPVQATVMIGHTVERNNTEDLEYGILGYNLVDTTGINQDLFSKTDDELFTSMSNMISIFTVFDGQLNTVGNDMVRAFRYGNGNPYENTVIGDKVAMSSNFINFLKSFGGQLLTGLNDHNGNINQVPVINIPSRPHFNSLYDRGHGLQILINDTEYTQIWLESLLRFQMGNGQRWLK